MTEKLADELERALPLLDGLETGQDCEEYAYAKAGGFQAMTYCPDAFEALRCIPQVIATLRTPARQDDALSALVASHIAEIGEGPFVVLKDEDGEWMTRTLVAHEALTRTAPADEIEAVARAIEEAIDLSDELKLDIRLGGCFHACAVEALSALTRNREGELREAARDVLAERKRQVTDEGWTPEHDDEHATGELARAAACYAVGRKIEEGVSGQMDRQHRPIARDLWPWRNDWWKPGTDRRRQLVKAGALILAEIERMDRAALSSEGGKHG